MKRWIVSALLSGSVTLVMPQEDSPLRLTGKFKGGDYFFGGFETSTVPYINNNTKDSNGTSIYLAAYLDYNHRSGIGLRLKSYTLPGGSDPGPFVTALTAYYGKYDGKVLPMLSYTRYFQHENRSVPYSPIQNELYGHLRVKTAYVDPQIGIDIGFGNNEENNDEGVSEVNAFFALGHLFIINNLGEKDNTVLAFWPTIQLNAGTDRYFKYLHTSRYVSRNIKLNRLGYGQRRGNSNPSPGNGMLNTDSTFILSEENDFSISNLEANLRLMLFWGRFAFEPAGSIYFPVRGTDRTPYGYWQFNMSIQIR